MKEFWIAAHMKLVEEYMEANPGSTWDEAYELTADRVDDQLREDVADMADHARLMEKEGRLR
jgi:hypothetical protein